MKTRLTTEQSQHLINLGVPKEKASDIEEYSDPVSQWIHRGAPIFTLEDFLNGKILPWWIEFGNDKYGLSIKYNPFGSKHEAYYDSLFYSFDFCKEELIDALYELACWYYGEYLRSEKK